MERIIRYTGIVAILAVVAVVTIGAVQSQTTPAQPLDQVDGVIDQTMLDTGSLTVSVSATGSVEPLRDVTLGFEITSPVTEVLVEEGETVGAGDVLARLDTDDLEVQLRNAEITLRSQEVELLDLLADPTAEELAAAEAALNAAYADAGAAYDSASSENDVRIAELEAEMARNQLWQSQLDRDITLQTPPEFRTSDTNDPDSQEISMTGIAQQREIAIEREQVEIAAVANTGPDMSRLGSAQASIIEAQIALDDLTNGPDEIDQQIAEASLEVAEMSLEQVRLEVEKGTLRAPFDGVVSTNNLQLGEVPPTDALDLINLSDLFIELDIDENDVRDVQIGQTVLLDFDALPNAEITGTVTEVDSTPNGRQPVTYRTRVSLDPTDEPVRVGMTATAEIVVDELDDVLIVPNRFIRFDPVTDQEYLTIVNANGQLQEVAVEVGLNNDTQTQILGGVGAGQTIVLLQREADIDAGN